MPARSAAGSNETGEPAVVPTKGKGRGRGRGRGCGVEAAALAVVPAKGKGRGRGAAAVAAKDNGRGGAKAAAVPAKGGGRGRGGGRGAAAAPRAADFGIHDRELGCPRCRWGKKRCATCRDPSYTYRGTRGRPRAEKREEE